MTQAHSPAVIAAAKALAEKHGLDDAFEARGYFYHCLCEALANPFGGKFRLGDTVTKTKGSNWTGKVVGFYSTSLTPRGYAVESATEKGSVQIYPEAALSTTLPSEEAMELQFDMRRNGGAAQKPTPKPEPTEDHLRRACEELNAGCTVVKGWTYPSHKNTTAVHTVARLLAERDAMQARVEGLFDAIKHGDAEHQDWLRMMIRDHFSAEPTPDPDLVLAREAAAQEFPGGYQGDGYKRAESAALRALKLAKERGK
jgi:dihydrofolate reductase (trimethoprim resistance protein)